MRFSPSFLEEIKARVPVSEIVRRRVKLKKSGREYVGLSPFGQEKTPSFFVNDGKMAWFDFSSGKNGNVFAFLMETEGLTFVEAVERLAGEAGLPVPARTLETDREAHRRASLHEVCEWAAAFFESELRSERGAKARAYLDGRGIDLQTRREFRIGFASPGRFALRDALAAKGADVSTMCEAGLLIHGDDVAVPYDRFRDRIMFPIHDRVGRVIAFGGRALEKNVAAKYLNSPETPLFHKGRLLFNQHRARKAAYERSRVIAVEGYIDVIAMHAAGFPEAVAGLGTALTEEQANLLWGMAREPVLCFDGDKAGIKAAARAAAMAMPMLGPDKTLSFALLPKGHDPDELIRNAGADAMKDVIAAAVPLVDMVWSRAVEGRPLATPEQREGLLRELAAQAKAIKDVSLAKQYDVEFRDRAFAHFRDLRGAARTDVRRPTYRKGAGNSSGGGWVSKPMEASTALKRNLADSATGVPPREALILLILLRRPDLVEDHAEEIAAMDFADLGGSASDLDRLRDRILEAAHESYDDGMIGAGAALANDLHQSGFGATIDQITRAHAAVPWYLLPESPPQDAASVLRQALVLHHEALALNRELHSLEQALASDAGEVNTARLRDIREQLSAPLGKEATSDDFGRWAGRSDALL